MLYFDKTNSVWKYFNKLEEGSLYDTLEDDIDEEYTKDELVHVDYDLTSKIKMGDHHYKVNLSYLENSAKTLNKLNTLEDMLVPMRYSRSVSRRLFNIDNADLPPAKAKENMDAIRAEFKYKKSYDIETGQIKGMVATHPMVEDYWMSNRSGSRGTTVEVMDEKGSLMDLDDIMLTGKKLYASLKIPTNRNPYADQDGGNFGYDSDKEITNEELQFFLFIDRLRIPVIKMLKDILKRQVIYTGVMSEKEWNKYSEKIKITFTSASIYVENMKRDLYLRKLENFEAVKEQIGTIYSLETVAEEVLNMGSVELLEELDKIEQEKQNPKYRNFYSSNEDDF